MFNHYYLYDNHKSDLIVVEITPGLSVNQLDNFDLACDWIYRKFVSSLESKFHI